METKKGENLWFLDKEKESNEIKKGKRFNKEKKKCIVPDGNQKRSDEPHAVFQMGRKESGSGLKSKVRAWLDGEERWVFVIEEKIKKVKGGKWK